MENALTNAVFVSYRRESAAGEARALFNDLVRLLGKPSVFMDVDSIALGHDFRNALQETLSSCDLMLVLIDRDWADARDDQGRMRLSDPYDFVRLEIETALKRDIVVTPVLVRGGRMPNAEQLPEEIRNLVYRNAFELSHSRWGSDFQEMVRRLGLNGAGADQATEPIGHASVAASVRSDANSWRVWGMISAAVLVTLLIVALGGLWFHNQTTQPQLSSLPVKPGKVTTLRVSDYVGGWTNADRNTRSITWISVREEGNGLVMQVWGRCHPTDCDWGSTQAAPFSHSVAQPATAGPVDSLVAHFATSFADRRVSLHVTSSGELSSVVDTHFTDTSGRADYETTDRFVRAKTSLPDGN
jgi:hypothetical protein